MFSNKKRVCVVVLGDIGRSPRMQYHVKSLLNEGFDVDIIGYVDSAPIEEIKKRANIKSLSKIPDFNLPRTLNYVFKTLWQILTLFTCLFSISKPQYVLCQNPPAVPTLFVCYIYCIIMRSKLIIDWHNYAHTILALNNSPTGFLVKFSKKMEIFFGRKSYGNFCVTKAMKKDLEENYGIRADVLYDRPPSEFRPITIEEKHILFRKLCEDYIEFNPEVFSYHSEKNAQILEETIFTVKLKSGKIELKNDRPGLLISSTSWTPDEDFNILLSALEEYEKCVEIDRKHYPNLICVITGKGPMKTEFMETIFSKQFNHVQIITPWLENDQYPVMLAASDIGVCLHWSSSGLDLPMKIVDMFGCGLPVCAVNFKCLNELVEHGKNGFIFENSKELSEYINNWFYDFPSNISLFDIKNTFNEHLHKFQLDRWDSNWKRNALPIFKTN